MAHLAADNRPTQEHWGNNNNSVSSHARLAMLGQMQQPIDFSSEAITSTPPPAHVTNKHIVIDVVDLSTRGARNSMCDDTSSSSSSIKSEIVQLPAANSAHPSNTPWPMTSSPMSPAHFPPITPHFPLITNTQLPSIFKKSASMTRPFKAYPKDPLNLPIGLVGGASDSMLSDPSNKAYAEFRRQMLAQVVAAKTRRTSSSPVPEHLDDHKPSVGGQATQPEEAGSPQHPSSSATDPSVILMMKERRDPSYWERRRKNNEAAKRSRDARRAKEDEIAIRAAFLEQENLKLKYEVAALRNETSRLRCMLYTSN